MFLYHSFPRVINRRGHRTLSLKKEAKFGLDILENIVHYGLLLTPEEFRISREKNQPSSKVERTLKRSPRRACFTALNEGELDTHGNSFGRFSIGIDAIDARILGMVPTIYVYDAVVENNSEVNDVTDGGVPLELVHRLRDIHSLCSAIARFEAKLMHVDPDYNFSYSEETLDFFGYQLEEDDKNLDKISNVTIQLAREIVEHLPTKRAPAQHLAMAVEILLSMFQKTDGHEGEALLYYAQREWRLVSMYSPNINLIHMDLNSYPDEIKNTYKKNYAEAYNDYLNIYEEIRSSSAMNGTKLNLQNCSLFNAIQLTAQQKGMTRNQNLKIGWNYFFDFVQHVLVPKDCMEEALSITNASGIHKFQPKLDNSMKDQILLRRVI